MDSTVFATDDRNPGFGSGATSGMTTTDELVARIAEGDSKIAELVAQNTHLDAELRNSLAREEALKQQLGTLSSLVISNGAHQKTVDFERMYEQLIYKDNKIVELNNLILEKERQIFDLQETLRGQDEAAQAKRKAVQIVNQRLQEIDARQSTLVDAATETDSSLTRPSRQNQRQIADGPGPSSSGGGGRTTTSGGRRRVVSPGRAYPQLKLGGGNHSPPPLDPAEDMSSYTTETATADDPDREFSPGTGPSGKSTRRYRKKVTFNLRAAANAARQQGSVSPEVDDRFSREWAGVDSEVAQQIIDLTNENDELRRVIAEIDRTPVVDQQFRVAELEEELANAIKTGKNEVLRARAAAQSRIAELENKIKEHEDKAVNEQESFESILDTLRDSRDHVVLENARLQEKIDALRETERQLRSEIEGSIQLSLGYRRELDTVLREDRDLKATVKHTNAELMKIRDERSVAYKEIQRLKEAISAQDNLIQVLESDVVIYETHIGLLRESLGASNLDDREIAKAKAADAKVDALEVERDDMIRQQNEERLRTKELTIKVQYLEQERDELVEQIRRLQGLGGRHRGSRATGSSATIVTQSSQVSAYTFPAREDEYRRRRSQERQEQQDRQDFFFGAPVATSTPDLNTNSAFTSIQPASFQEQLSRQESAYSAFSEAPQSQIGGATADAQVAELQSQVEALSLANDHLRTEFENATADFVAEKSDLEAEIGRLQKVERAVAEAPPAPAPPAPAPAPPAPAANIMPLLQAVEQIAVAANEPHFFPTTACSEVDFVDDGRVLKQLDDENAVLKRTADDLAISLDEARERIAELEAANRKASELEMQLEGEKFSLELEAGHLRSLLAQRENDLEDAIRTQSAEVESIKAERESLKKALEETEARLETIVAEKKSLQDLVKELEAKNVSLSESFDRMQAFENENNRLEVLVNTLRSEVEHFRVEAELSRTCLEDLHRTILRHGGSPTAVANEGDVQRVLASVVPVPRVPSVDEERALVTANEVLHQTQNLFDARENEELWRREEVLQVQQTAPQQEQIDVDEIRRQTAEEFQQKVGYLEDTLMQAQAVHEITQQKLSEQTSVLQSERDYLATQVAELSAIISERSASDADEVTAAAETGIRVAELEDEVQRLTRRVEDLAAQKAGEERQHQAIVRELNEERHRLSEDFLNLQNAQKLTVSQLEQLKIANGALESALGQSQLQAENLSSMNAALAQEAGALKAECEKMKEAVTKADDHVNICTENVVNATLSAVDRDFDDHRAPVADAETQSDPVQQPPTTASTTVDATSDVITSDMLRDYVRETHQFNEGVTADVESLFVLNDELANAADCLKGQVWALNRQLTKCIAERQEIIDELAKLEEGRKSVLAENERLKSEVGALERAREENEGSWQARVDSLNESKAAVENAYNELSAKYEALQATYEGLIARLGVPKVDASTEPLVESEDIEAGAVARGEVDQLARVAEDMRDELLRRADKIRSLEQALRDTLAVSAPDEREASVTKASAGSYDSVKGEKATAESAILEIKKLLLEAADTLHRLPIDEAYDNVRRETEVRCGQRLDNALALCEKVFADMQRCETSNEPSTTAFNPPAGSDDPNGIEYVILKLHERWSAKHNQLLDHTQVLHDHEERYRELESRLSDATEKLAELESRRSISSDSPARLTAKQADNDALFRATAELANTNVELQNKLDELEEKIQGQEGGVSAETDAEVEVEDGGNEEEGVEVASMVVEVDEEENPELEEDVSDFPAAEPFETPEVSETEDEDVQPPEPVEDQLPEEVQLVQKPIQESKEPSQEPKEADVESSVDLGGAANVEAAEWAWQDEDEEEEEEQAPTPPPTTEIAPPPPPLPKSDPEPEPTPEPKKIPPTPAQPSESWGWGDDDDFGEDSSEPEPEPKPEPEPVKAPVKQQVRKPAPIRLSKKQEIASTKVPEAKRETFEAEEERKLAPQEPKPTPKVPKVVEQKAHVPAPQQHQQILPPPPPPFAALDRLANQQQQRPQQESSSSIWSWGASSVLDKIVDTILLPSDPAPQQVRVQQQPQPLQQQRPLQQTPAKPKAKTDEAPAAWGDDDWNNDDDDSQEEEPIIHHHAAAAAPSKKSTPPREPAQASASNQGWGWNDDGEDDEDEEEVQVKVPAKKSSKPATKGRKKSDSGWDW